ncbi:MAG: nuclear transport factor 2 family protein, partial [Pricia sp.]|nr:nuclear transport factor 2 family protein [Pricia sp.]
MKEIILTTLVVVFIASCQPKTEERYSTNGPEVDLVKSLVNDYHNQDWEGWLGHYADTAKLHHNSPEDIFLTPSETSEALKDLLATTSSYKFDDENIYYEKVIDDKGKTWVNFWGNWRGTIAASNKELVIPVHLTMNIADNKIQEEHAMYNLAEYMAEMQKIEARNNMSTEDKATQTTIDNITKAWNTNDQDLMYSNLASNVVRTANGTIIAKNQSDYGDFMDVYHSAFPDFKVSLDNVKIDGNTAQINWTCTGT